MARVVCEKDSFRHLLNTSPDLLCLTVSCSSYHRGSQFCVATDPFPHRCHLTAPCLMPIWAHITSLLWIFLLKLIYGYCGTLLHVLHVQSRRAWEWHRRSLCYEHLSVGWKPIKFLPLFPIARWYWDTVSMASQMTISWGVEPIILSASWLDNSSLYLSLCIMPFTLATHRPLLSSSASQKTQLEIIQYIDYVINGNI